MAPQNPPRPVGTLALSALSLALLASAFPGQAQERQVRPTRPRLAEPVPVPAPPRTLPGPDVIREPRLGPPRGERPGGPGRKPGDRLRTPDDRPPHIPAVRPQIIAKPRPMAICTVRPDAAYWRSRDILKEIQHMARRGNIQVQPVDDEALELVGYTSFPAGWKAYGFRVAPNGKLHVRLHHSNEGWFRLAMMNKWGMLEPGMLQNLTPTGNPEVSFENPTDTVKVVYVLVDDPGLMSTPKNPFTFKIERSWDPKEKLQDAPFVQGIWATTNDISAEHAQPKKG